MNDKKSSDSYEVGYGRPPKNTRFQKGLSGNPKGRPKKALDYGQELLRQSRATVTINENGSRHRISKHELVIKQLINNAIRGDIRATRAYLGHHQIASEKEALREASKPSGPIKPEDLHSLTDEELERIIRAGQKDEEKKTKK